MKETKKKCKCCAYIQFLTPGTISACLESRGPRDSNDPFTHLDLSWLLPLWSWVYFVLLLAFSSVGVGDQPDWAWLSHLGQSVWPECCKVSTVTAALAVISLKSRYMIRWAYMAFNLTFSSSFLYVAVNPEVADEFIWCILTLMIYFPTSS